MTTDKQAGSTLRSTGLLICDHIPVELASISGQYPAMFRALLPALRFEEYYVYNNQFPLMASQHDAWIITGSKYAVYDDIEWIKRLLAFIEEIRASGKPCAGICFGHQAIGQALGGRVTRADTGWHAGIHEFEVYHHEPWMEPFSGKIKLNMMCQDQIMVLPEGTKVLAGKASCPNAVIRSGNMLGIQGHPEFSTVYEKALIQANLKYIPDQTIQNALISLEQHVDNKTLAQWIMNFITATG